MTKQLVAAVSRYTKIHANVDGIASTPVPGLWLIRSTAQSEIEHDIASPLICLVLQGTKQVTVGNRDLNFSPGDSMVVAANMPTVSRISEASAAIPYLAIALDLDPAVIADLGMAESAVKSVEKESTATIDTELYDAMYRMIKLLERPRSLAILHKQIVREIHHWILLGKQGRAIRELGLPESQVRRISRAVTLLRNEYTQRLSIGRLAEAAGMGRSAFHKHFRLITSLSPLQFQKQLRLIEARRLLLSLGKMPSRVAFEVGYQSVSQFTREYSRMFGLPPATDRRSAKKL